MQSLFSLNSEYSQLSSHDTEMNQGSSNFFSKWFLKESSEPVEGNRTVYIQSPSQNSQFIDNKISNTKYTLLLFIPMNLYEQFSRFMNRYFLIIAILQLFPTLTPVSPVTTWVPLALIFAISAIKEAYDDYKRYLEDKRANERQYEILKNDRFSQIQSQHIQVFF